MKKVLLFSLLFFMFIGGVDASSYVLMDITTGRVLSGKSYNIPYLMASVTKIMTI